MIFISNCNLDFLEEILNVEKESTQYKKICSGFTYTYVTTRIEYLEILSKDPYKCILYLKHDDYFLREISEIILNIIRLEQKK